MASDWANTEGVEDAGVLDPDATQDAVRRVVEAGTLVEIFRATDNSEALFLPDGLHHRFYPAGYVEEIFEKLHSILKGNDA